MTRSMWKVAVVGMVAGGLVAGGADREKNLLKEPNKPGSWRFEQHEQGKGTMKADQDAVLFDVTNVDGEVWHVQTFIHDVEFKEGKEYVFSYKAKGEATRTITATATIDEDDWHAIGLQEDV